MATQSTATSLNRVILLTLGRTYGHLGYRADSPAHRSISAILHEEDMPHAAWEVRSSLSKAFLNRTAAARATSNLFHALGRADELGHVAVEAGGYDREDYQSFLADLPASERDAITAYAR